MKTKTFKTLCETCENQTGTIEMFDNTPREVRECLQRSGLCESCAQTRQTERAKIHQKREAQLDKIKALAKSAVGKVATDLTAKELQALQIYQLESAGMLDEDLKVKALG